MQHRKIHTGICEKVPSVWCYLIQMKLDWFNILRWLSAFSGLIKDFCLTQKERCTHADMLFSSILLSQGWGASHHVEPRLLVGGLLSLSLFVHSTIRSAPPDPARNPRAGILDHRSVAVWGAQPGSGRLARRGGGLRRRLGLTTPAKPFPSFGYDMSWKVRKLQVCRTTPPRFWAYQRPQAWTSQLINLLGKNPENNPSARKPVHGLGFCLGLRLRFRLRRSLSLHLVE